MKKALSLIMALILCLGLCACGATGDADTKDEATTTAPAKETVAPTEATESESVAETESVVETEGAPAIEVNNVAVGDTIATDFVEILFNDVTVAEDIQMSVTTGFVTRITGPSPVSGQQYVCLSGTIKNISTSPLPVFDFFIGEFNLDGYTYEVDASDCDILDGEGQTMTNIDPLMEYTIRIYVAIPNALADSHSSCTLRFGFYDAFDNHEMSRNKAFEDDPISLCPYQYLVTLK